MDIRALPGDVSEHLLSMLNCSDMYCFLAASRTPVAAWDRCAPFAFPRQGCQLVNDRRNFAIQCSIHGNPLVNFSLAATIDKAIAILSASRVEIEHLARLARNHADKLKIGRTVICAEKLTIGPDIVEELNDLECAFRKESSARIFLLKHGAALDEIARALLSLGAELSIAEEPALLREMYGIHAGQHRSVRVASKSSDATLHDRHLSANERPAHSLVALVSSSAEAVYTTMLYLTKRWPDDISLICWSHGDHPPSDAANAFAPLRIEFGHAAPEDLQTCMATIGRLVIGYADRCGIGHTVAQQLGRDYPELRTELQHGNFTHASALQLEFQPRQWTAMLCHPHGPFVSCVDTRGGPHMPKGGRATLRCRIPELVAWAFANQV